MGGGDLAEVAARDALASCQQCGACDIGETQNCLVGLLGGLYELFGLFE